MKIRRGAVIGILAGALAAWGAYWFYAHFEKVPRQVYVGYQGEARYNTLLAAERLLASMGMRVKSMAGLQGLPPRDGTLVLPAGRQNIGPERASELLDWVNAGGHLVAVARLAESEKKTDPLLRGLGIRLSENPEVKGREQTLAVADLHGAGDFLEVAFDPRYRLEFPGRRPASIIADAHGAHAIVMALGRGRLTVLSDSGFMQNPHIGKYDHAAFVWHLARDRRNGEVWLIYGEDFPGLWELTWAHGWMVWVSAALALAAWLWSATGRLGPVLPEPSLARRRLLEHIEASGRFAWKHGQAPSMLKEVREALLRSLEYRHPGWTSSGNLYERLAQASGLSPDAVRSAFEDPVSDNQHAFTRTIQTLETIRNEL